MEWKIEQEWTIMRYFKECHPGFPKGKLVKGESPDFRLWTSPKRFIGIELTQVHHIDSDTSGQCILKEDVAIRQVLESVRLKEEKVRLYRIDAPFQLWLIIFADYSEPGAMEKVTEQIQKKNIETSFDKVFLFNLDLPKVDQLK